MDSYEKCESVGRQKMLVLFGDKYIIRFTEGKYDVVDFFATALTLSRRTYVGDIKNYEDRPYSKFENYMIDYAKLKNIKDKADEDGRIPVLVCFFTDGTIVWDLRKVDFESEKEWRWVNKDGQHYGREKEYSCVTYLHKEEAKWTSTAS